MNLPLPKETREYLISDKIRAFNISNLGLLLNKYVSAWSYDWATEEKRGKEKVNLKTEFLEKIEKEQFYINQIKMDSLYKRQLSIIQGLKTSGWYVESFNATTASRLILGLGGTSVIETGMTLHPLYGFPYLPGSGLKGLARAYAEIAENFPDEKTKKKLLYEIFGSEDKEPNNVANNRQGKVFFMDGLPIEFPKLELDIMNPHYGDYYSGKKDTKGNPIPPADYLNPNPVTFLAVAAEQKFSFAIYSRDKDLAEKAKAWFIGGLTELGAGGKTNVGYGYFKLERQLETSAVKKDDSLEARLQAVKSQQQTFIEFVKSIKIEEIDLLNDISFKGMESIINIGIVPDIENLKISSDIMKVVAVKMLEIIKPTKKWDEKKKDKYKKLQTMAGQNKE